MIVGLTGGICSGKTEAAHVLAAMGVRVVDADEISRFLTQYDSTVLSQIRQRFGSDVFSPYGALDRKRTGSLVFSDATARRDLEMILHPPIISLQRENIAMARAAGYPLVVSAPLLIEAGTYKDMDTVVLISCTVELQLERLMARRGLTAEEAQSRVNAQMSLKDKHNYADVVIDNNTTLADFQAKVRSTFSKLLQEPHA